jgi:predicted Rossmann fold nucleotide-binding protein DprA/Smf involved in DNA uptake
VLDALARGPRTRDALARELRLAPGDVALALLALELEGAVAEDRDGRVRLVSPLRGEGL